MKFRRILADDTACLNEGVSKMVKNYDIICEWSVKILTKLFLTMENNNVKRKKVDLHTHSSALPSASKHNYVKEH